MDVNLLFGSGFKQAGSPLMEMKLIFSLIETGALPASFLGITNLSFLFYPPRCKSKVIGTEVFIDSAASNVWPLEYREAKSERLTAILREKGRKAVEMEILFDYFSGLMQGGSRFPKAIEAAEKNGAITDHREQYDKCRIDPVYREQFLNTLHAYLSGRISPVPSAETQPEHATQQQLF